MREPTSAIGRAVAARIEDPRVREKAAAAADKLDEVSYAPAKAEAAAPRARYRIMFSSGWAACAEAMRATASFGVERVTWEHAGHGEHHVDFTATFDAMKAVQHAVWACGVDQPRCVRLKGSDEA